MLYGLDRFLFGEYFANREKPLMTLGSSAGAWRLSCLGTAAPLRAIDELAARYSRETYSAQPTVEEITEKMHSMLSAALGSSGAAEIAANLLIQTHIVADRCKGLAEFRIRQPAETVSGGKCDCERVQQALALVVLPANDLYHHASKRAESVCILDGSGYRHSPFNRGQRP